MRLGPGAYSVLAVAVQGLIGLVIIAFAYTRLAVAVHRRWGSKVLIAFWVVSAALLSLGAVARHVGSGAKPVAGYLAASMVAFVVLATAGGALRVAQVGRQIPAPSVRRQALAGCVGMMLAGERCC